MLSPTACVCFSVNICKFGCISVYMDPETMMEALMVEALMSSAELEVGVSSTAVKRKSFGSKLL